MHEAFEILVAVDVLMVEVAVEGSFVIFLLCRSFSRIMTVFFVCLKDDEVHCLRI